MNNETIINLNGYDTVKDNLTPITEVEDIAVHGFAVALTVGKNKFESGFRLGTLALY